MSAGKRLHLLRHAKSSWDDPSLPDRERPLNRRGERACGLIAEHLRRSGVAPELILCSPAHRTRQTLERISGGIAGEPEIRFEERVYEASAATLLELVRALPATTGSAMLIGHNPATAALAADLAAEGPERERLAEKFPTAAMATLELGPDWRSAAPGGGRLLEFVRPKDLG